MNISPTKRSTYRWMKRPKQQDIHRSKCWSMDKRVKDLIFYEKKPYHPKHAEFDPKEKRFVFLL